MSFRRCELPTRDWDSADVDPAVVLVRLLRANAHLVTDLSRRFAEARLPTFDIARLLWLWEENAMSWKVTAVAHSLGLSTSHV